MSRAPDELASSILISLDKPFIDKVKKIPVPEIMEWLNNFNRSQLERMGIDPDATPVGFGEAAMRTDTAPSEDNLLSMIDRFTEAQRVA